MDRGAFLAVFLLAAVTVTGIKNDHEDLLLRRVRSAHRVKRIIGGSSYDAGQWPWLVSLKGEIPSSWFWGFVTSYSNFYCGGSLINKRWVLTAGHCFNVAGAPGGIRDAGNWHIKAGDTKRTLTGLLDKLKQFWADLTNQPTATWWYIHAEKVIVHPNYNSKDMWANDVALVKLDRDLPLGSQYLQAVSLPHDVPANWPPANANCSMQGWGCTYDGGPLQEYARSVVMPVVSPEQCAEVFGNLGPNRLCAGKNLAQQGICKGDSGGPLACLDGTVWKQAGIASFASGQNSGNWPGCFTRVTAYSSWIAGIVASN